jgi:hypothetical protein
MQGHYPFAFEREMGCTADELRAWLPGACEQRPITWLAHAAEIAIDAGQARLEWTPLEPRRIALISLPRLRVRFMAQGLHAEAWQRFMRRFDLYTQRGGG